MAIKPQHLIPIGAALAGFAIGWGLKPAATIASPDGATKDAAGRPTAGGANGSDRSRESRGSRPTGVRTAAAVAAQTTPEDLQLQNRLEIAFKNAGSQRDRAKLVRMAEALGLSAEQIAKAETLIADQRQSNPMIGVQAGMSPKETLEKATESAKALDARFRELLSPDQVAALDTLQTRQQQNRAEAQAQRELSDVVDRIDVNDAQREGVLEVLRKAVTDEQAALPEGSNLLGESSLLGAGGHGFSDRSLEAMRALGESSIGTDPLAVGQKMQEMQREQNRKRAEALAQILTPGQLQQYRAAAEGQAAVGGAGFPRR